MNKERTLNQNLEAIAWGGLLIWWGITELATFLPAGTGAVGIGLILLGINAVRYMNGIPTRSFSTILGLLALVWGVVELAKSVLRLPFELPAFAIVLIVWGVIVLARTFTGDRNLQKEA